MPRPDPAAYAPGGQGEWPAVAAAPRQHSSGTIQAVLSNLLAPAGRTRARRSRHTREAAPACMQEGRMGGWIESCLTSDLRQTQISCHSQQAARAACPSRHRPEKLRLRRRWVRGGREEPSGAAPPGRHRRQHPWKVSEAGRSMGR
eukprot:scaffold78541_cov62-Phaeocystis_antarctica.AAC.3